MILEIPPQSYVAWRSRHKDILMTSAVLKSTCNLACITLFHVMAALSTIFRLRERYQTRQMWLDDYLVILPMTVDIVYCIIPWILPSVSPGEVNLTIILHFIELFPDDQDPRRVQHSDDDDSWATYLFSFTIIW
jgi:hypothetical protein